MKRFLAALLAVTLLIGLMIPIGASAVTQYATVVGGWLRLRASASFSSSTISSYNTGTQVRVLGISGKWYNVETPDGRVGFMYGDYLTMGGSVIIPDGNANATVISSNGYGVRLRTGPGTGYSIIRKYAVGTRVQILEYGSYWSRISVNGVVGYMMNQFLSRDGSVTPTYDGDATVWSSNGYGVRLRTGPGTGYSKIGVYSVGTQVRIISKGPVWDYIQIGSRTGYMMNQFLIYNTNYEVTAITINNLNPVVGNVLAIQSVTPASATLTYQWYVGGTAKSGATQASYTVTADDVGKAIQLVAYGTGSYTGVAYSAETAPVAASSVVTDAVINNMTPVVGDMLSVTSTIPANATVRYNWVVGNNKRTSTDAIFAVTSADIGETISLTVTGTGNFTGSKTVTTGAVTATGTLSDLTVTNVTNPGKDPDIGDTIKVVPVPATATAAYQWTIGTETATGQTIVVKDTWHNTDLSVTATGNGTYSGSITKNITIGMPSLTVSAISFDDVQQGYAQPAAKYLTVENTGTAKAHITSVTVDNNFTVTPGSGTVDAKTTADKVWAVQPKTGLTTGSYINTITFTYDDNTKATATVAMTVTAAAPKLVIDPVDFGSIYESSSLPAAQTISVKNIGLVAAENVVLAMDSGSSAAYTIAAQSGTTIPAGGQITFTLVPNTNAAGTYNTNVTAASDTSGAINATATVKFVVKARPTLTIGTTATMPLNSTSPVSITLTASNAAVENIICTNFESSQFTLTQGNKAIEQDVEDYSWKLTPKTSLTAGTYDVKATFTYNGMAANATTTTIHVTVEAAPATTTTDTVADTSANSANTSGTELKVIDSITLSYIAPTGGEAPFESGWNEGYNYQISWNPTPDGCFEAGQAYTAAIKITPDEGYTLADPLSVTAGGQTVQASGGECTMTFTAGEAASEQPAEDLVKDEGSKTPDESTLPKNNDLPVPEGGSNEAGNVVTPETPSELGEQPEALPQAQDLLWTVSTNGLIMADWSDVAGAYNYLVSLKKDGQLVRSYPAAYSMCEFPAGDVQDGYTFTVIAYPADDTASMSAESQPSLPYSPVKPASQQSANGTDVTPAGNGNTGTNIVFGDGTNTGLQQQ